MAATAYLVFEKAADAWQIVGTYQSTSAGSAKAKAALEHGAGTYAAVPARSWEPRTFEVESVARVVKP